MHPYYIIALSFLFTGSLVYAVAEARTRQTRRLRDRLDHVTGRFQFIPPAEAKAPPGLRADSFPTVSRWLDGSDLEKRLRLAMIRADLRWRPGEWVALCAATSAASCLLGLLATRMLLTGLVMALLGLLLPILVLKSRQAARRTRFEAQTPDALLLMTPSLRAGHAFLSTMQTVADELPPPLADEFLWASGEARLGVPLETALGRMVERVQSPDLDLIVTAILIQLPIGGNLAEVLDAIAETIRERVRMQGEVRTLTAEGRLSAIVLMVLAPALALLLHLRNPAYFQPLLETLSGRWMIGGAIAGQILGGLIIRRMVTLDV